jgi:hypothetical protein
MFEVGGVTYEFHHLGFPHSRNSQGSGTVTCTRCTLAMIRADWPACNGIDLSLKVRFVLF